MLPPPANPPRRETSHLISIGTLVLQAAQAPLSTAPQAAQAAGAAKSMLPPNVVIGNWIQFAGYFLAIGAIGFRLGVTARLRRTGSEALLLLRTDTAASLGALGAALLLLSLVGGTFTQSLMNHTTFYDALPKRSLGRYEFRAVMMAVAFLGFLLVRTRAKPGWTIATVCVLLTVLQPVVNLRVSGIANAFHILAASAWLGTLLVLTIVGIRDVMKRNPASPPRTRLIADLVTTFSPVALASAALLLASGIVTGWLHVKRISALVDMPYGNALIVKLVLVAIVVSLGAWNWKKVTPVLEQDGAAERLSRSATWELTVGALVLAATAILVTLPSPK